MPRKEDAGVLKEETGSAEGRDRKCQGRKMQEVLRKEETESTKEET